MQVDDETHTRAHARTRSTHDDSRAGVPRWRSVLDLGSLYVALVSTNPITKGHRPPRQHNLQLHWSVHLAPQTSRRSLNYWQRLSSARSPCFGIVRSGRVQSTRQERGSKRRLRRGPRAPPLPGVPNLRAASGAGRGAGVSARYLQAVGLHREAGSRPGGGFLPRLRRMSGRCFHPLPVRQSDSQTPPGR